MPTARLPKSGPTFDKNEIDKKAKVLTKLNFQDERDVSAEQQSKCCCCLVSVAYSCQ